MIQCIVSAHCSDPGLVLTGHVILGADDDISVLVEPRQWSILLVKSIFEKDILVKIK